MRKLLAITAIVSGGLLQTLSTPAFAQGFNGNQYGRTNDPNMGHFYMARQQIQILDNQPYVNDMRTNPAAAGAQQAPPGAMGPRALPRAGFVGYTPSVMPSMSGSLPKVVNGVPPKPVPVALPRVDPRLAKAGKYKPAPQQRAVARGPQVTKTYAPYKGYGGPSSPSVAQSQPQMNYNRNPGNGSSTAVRGSLLHWSRTGH